MTRKEIAEEYIKRFCRGDIEGIGELFAPNLKFTGTLYTYNSAKEYLDSLRDDPPEKSEYNILSITENHGSVAVFYEYSRPGLEMTIAQLFKIRNGKIREVLLVFDARDFIG